jgi:hypothetical protein
MSTPRLKPMAELFEDARAAIQLALSNETYQSYPILLPPRQRGGPPLAAFLYGVSRSIRAKGRYFVAPNLLATLDATSAVVESRKEVIPRDLGVAQKPGELIGLHALAQGMTPEEYAARRTRLFELYDRLADAFVKGDDAHRHTRQATEFHTLFFRLSEAPLAPYYRSVGRAFFSWVQQA